MKKFETADEALDFAIGEEQAAADFYDQLSSKVAKPGMKELLRTFAGEERKHKEKLLAVKRGERVIITQLSVTDLQIGDYLVDVEPRSDLGYQDALIVAMKKEKAAYRMYADLAEKASNPDLRNLFLSLAGEEANHKLRFEIEYDDEVLTEG